MIQEGRFEEKVHELFFKFFCKKLNLIALNYILSPREENNAKLKALFSPARKQTKFLYLKMKESSSGFQNHNDGSFLFCLSWSRVDYRFGTCCNEYSVLEWRNAFAVNGDFN